MNKKLKIIFLLFSFLFMFSCYAQEIRIQNIHKVKKQETVFGIAKQYGISMDELKNANPDMKKSDFVLKKGMKLNIPYPAPPTPKPKPIDPLTRKATIGVMLPLHDINGDGKRMVEYYRGVLLAVEQMKKEGYNVDVNAWNVAEGDDVRATLLDNRAAQCNVIFGPLYSTQVPVLADFCRKNNIKLVIPFSINATDVQTNEYVYQVYQTPSNIIQESIRQYVNSFHEYNTVIIDCNDVTSKKGEFTFGLRSVLENRGIKYQITNLNSSMELFQKAFSRSQRNMVVLNTGRSQELLQVYQKLELLQQQYEGISISMFGYNEWFLYLRAFQQRMRNFDTYIPSYFNYNIQSPEIMSLEENFQRYYNMPMQQAIPRFAITGYDQAMLFLRGLKKYGKEFLCLPSQTNVYDAVQTSYLFEKLQNGGYQNKEFLLVHIH